MGKINRVRHRPPKPLMLFDGDCGFCRRWIQRWQRATGEHVDYLPFQDPLVAQRFPEIPIAQFEQAVHLIDVDGRVTTGAEAVARSQLSVRRWPLWLYRHLPGAAPLAEWAYRLLARNRTALSRLGFATRP